MLVPPVRLSYLLKHHPAEQGLKHGGLVQEDIIMYTSKASSSRTRIETSAQYRHCHNDDSSKASSSRTRIETVNGGQWAKERKRLLKHHPAEQGLKHNEPIVITLSGCLLKHHPAEQGLKPNLIKIYYNGMSSSKASSSRTRIETKPIAISGYENSRF